MSPSPSISTPAARSRSRKPTGTAAVRRGGTVIEMVSAPPFSSDAVTVTGASPGLTRTSAGTAAPPTAVGSTTHPGPGVAVPPVDASSGPAPASRSPAAMTPSPAIAMITEEAPTVLTAAETAEVPPCRTTVRLPAVCASSWRCNRVPPYRTPRSPGTSMETMPPPEPPATGRIHDPAYAGDAIVERTDPPWHTAKEPTAIRPRVAMRRRRRSPGRAPGSRRPARRNHRLGSGGPSMPSFGPAVVPTGTTRRRPPRRTRTGSSRPRRNGSAVS